MSWDQPDTTVSMPMKEMGNDSDSYWRGIFDRYDLNKDGRISYDELKALIQSSEAKELPKNVAEKIMTLADKNNSGSLDFEEFKDMMFNPDFKAVFGHFMMIYVYTIIPRRTPVSAVDPLHGFQSVAPSEGVRWRTISYESKYSCWPPAFFMVLISLLEVVLFICDAAQGNTVGNGTVGKIFHYHPKKREQAWRFITYMLVHSGYSHLILNVLVQLFLGVPLEMVHRWWRVALVYLAGVAAGSLALSLADPQQPLVGASGGVAALLTAHIATIIMNWSEMKYASYQLAVFLTLASLAIGSAVHDIYWGLNQKVGHVTHVAGAIAGLLVGIGVLRNLRGRRWEKRLWWAAMVLFFLFMSAGILANIFWTSRFDANYRKFVINADEGHNGRNITAVQDGV